VNRYARAHIASARKGCLCPTCYDYARLLVKPEDERPELPESWPEPGSYMEDMLLLNPFADCFTPEHWYSAMCSMMADRAPA
jgi:hypothetical protein